MAEVDWRVVFQFCAENRERFSPEDQQVLKRGMWGINLTLIAGILSALVTDSLAFRLPAVRMAHPILRLNICAFCMAVPAGLWCHLGLRKFLKPAFLSVYQKNSDLARP